MAAFRENEGGGRLTVTARAAVTRRKYPRYRVQGGANNNGMLTLPIGPLAGLAQVQESGGPCREAGGGGGPGPVTDLGSEVLSGVPGPVATT
jgi:hypothetical protein